MERTTQMQHISHGRKHERLTRIYMVRSVQNSPLTTGICASTVFTTKTRWSQSGRTRPVYNSHRPAEQISQVYHRLAAYAAQPHVSVLCVQFYLIRLSISSFYVVFTLG
ncbi:hypothetical protein D915_003329 [Fasciola hepatica]|uniref:Uncharacterized protein n=1 Tax=Fasciola hepatica TaxID=6192 RepID=A0A4E0S0X3_FASHE|nr:hypothetical protein D915_003329 [Fasciola hepatica]